jgi:DNA invertase Pin-like site-specific DNA recombinase
MKAPGPSAAARPTLRCAIYTRKSSEEGLEQSFNSLDAQREACEAYVLSQTGEGWSTLASRYDDGGYSGGSIERPGLKQLLADIALRKIDVVVVYKVDRLTRSLADFGKIVEILDAHGVSFVSVTQAFNTTSSMGRLTLNVLLSFAQFEREVTGERIRDKIAASKKKGMWMGGTPPFGYRAHERTLVINEDEAQTVRGIFERYLTLRSVHALKAELVRDGICSRPSRRTNSSEAVPFSRGALYHLLSNRVYAGEIVHKDQSYPGQHPAIIQLDQFEQVGALLAENRRERRERKHTVARAPLTGLLFDGEGRSVCPVAARNKGERVYCYYVSAHLQQGGRGTGDGAGIRISAPALEKLVLERLSAAVPAAADWETARSLIQRVELDDNRLTIVAKPSGRVKLNKLPDDTNVSHLDDGCLRIVIPVWFPKWAGRTEVVAGSTSLGGFTPKVDRSLVRGLARAHGLVRTAQAKPNLRIEDIGKREGAAPSYIRRLSRLAFLAPDIQQALVDGQQPLGINLERLMRIDLPLSWQRQRELLGFERS